MEIFTSSQTVKVDGNGEKVTSIRIKDRLTGEERDFPLDGIFVQIGLAANSAPFRDKLETTPTGRLKIDAFCRTITSGGSMRQGECIECSLQADSHCHGRRGKGSTLGIR